MACRSDASGDVVRKLNSNLLPVENKAGVTLSVTPINGTGSGSRSPLENWELDCEVCGRKGINQVGYLFVEIQFISDITPHVRRTMVFLYCAVVHAESGNILFAMTNKTQ